MKIRVSWKDFSYKPVKATAAFDEIVKNGVHNVYNVQAFSV